MLHRNTILLYNICINSSSAFRHNMISYTYVRQYNSMSLIPKDSNNAIHQARFQEISMEYSSRILLFTALNRVMEISPMKLLYTDIAPGSKCLFKISWSYPKALPKHYVPSVLRLFCCYQGTVVRYFL